MRDAIIKAVEICGGQSALARRLGVRQGHVWYWMNRARKAPSEHCRSIERATGSQVTVHDLRPDVFGEPEHDPVADNADAER